MSKKKNLAADEHTADLLGMDISDTVHKAIQEVTAPEMLLTATLKKKLKELRIRLSSIEKQTLLDACTTGIVSGDWSKLSQFEVKRRGLKDILLNVSPADADSTINKTIEAVEVAIPKIIRKASQLTYPFFKDQVKEYDNARVADNTLFNNRLRKSYGAALSEYSHFLSACILAGNASLLSLTPGGKKRQTPKRVALLRLHHRACRVAVEIGVLLESGLSEGAMARWRTMHEIAVCASFIESKKSEVAKRFLQHEVFQRRKIEELVNKRTGDAPDTSSRDNLISELRAAYGKEYGRDYGWAAFALGQNFATFEQLEEAANFGFVRVEYAKANAAIHASSLGLMYRPGLDLIVEPGSDADWAITTNLGLLGPAKLASWSLLNTTIALLNSLMTMERLVLSFALIKAQKRVSKKFELATQRIELRESRLHRQ